MARVDRGKPKLRDAALNHRPPGWGLLYARAAEEARLVARNLFNRRGLDIHELGSLGRGLPLVLDAVKEAGWRPRTIVDVGVAYGTAELYSAFPGSFLLLIEPVVAWHRQLERRLRGRAHEIVPLAAWSDSGDIEITVHRDPGATSAYTDLARRNENATRIRVSAASLDSITANYRLAAPVLLKIDVQGAELRVLTGAPALLKETDVVLVEGSLRRNYLDGPLVDDVIELLRRSHFRLFDVFGGNASAEGKVLRQVDLAFVRLDSELARMLLS